MPGLPNPVLNGEWAENASQDIRALDSKLWETQMPGIQSYILATVVVLIGTLRWLFCSAGKVALDREQAHGTVPFLTTPAVVNGKTPRLSCL